MNASERICVKTKTVSNAVDLVFNRAIASAGLTSVQASTLRYLALRRESGAEPPCQHDIENEFHIKHPTAAGILRRLSEKGLVAFQPDENDRRLKRILLTDAGAAAFAGIVHTLEETDNALMEGLSAEDVRKLGQLLDVVAQNAFAKTGLCSPKGDDRTC